MGRLQQVVTAGNQSRVDFTSIASAYSTLKVLWTASDVQAGTFVANMRVRLNDDVTAANYAQTNRVGSYNGQTFGTPLPSTANGFCFGALPQSGLGDIVGQGVITIIGYAGSKHKNVLAVYQADVSGIISLTSGRWKSNAPVNQITISSDGGGFVDGSVFTLYALD